MCIAVRYRTDLDGRDDCGLGLGTGPHGGLHFDWSRISPISPGRGRNTRNSVKSNKPLRPPGRVPRVSGTVWCVGTRRQPPIARPALSPPSPYAARSLAICQFATTPHHHLLSSPLHSPPSIPALFQASTTRLTPAPTPTLPLAVASTASPTDTAVVSEQRRRANAQTPFHPARLPQIGTGALPLLPPPRRRTCSLHPRLHCTT